MQRRTRWAVSAPLAICLGAGTLDLNTAVGQAQVTTQAVPEISGERVLRMLKAKDYRSAESELRRVLSDESSEYIARVELLAICLIEQGRAPAAISEIEQAIAARPEAIELKVFGFEVFRDVLDAEDRLPSIARKLGTDIAKLGGTDKARAQAALRKVAAAAIEPELLEPLMQKSVQMASAQASAHRSPHKGHLDSLREASNSLTQGTSAVRKCSWAEAQAAFESAAAWVNDAAPGYPRHAAVLVPMIKAAAAASALFNGQVGTARTLCNEGLQSASLGQQKARLQTVLALCESLRGSPLDRGGNSRDINQAEAEANAWQAQAAATTASLPTQMYVDSWCSNMLWSH